MLYTFSHFNAHFIGKKNKKNILRNFTYDRITDGQKWVEIYLFMFLSILHILELKIREDVIFQQLFNLFPKEIMN